MNRETLIQKYIAFFKEKNHKLIENASLIPKEDPTVLFTTAGMHPLVPFLRGQKHPLGKRLVSVQKCIRTGDIEEVGDSVHHTFFEMLGNWSLGDYQKKQAIEYSYEFLTKVLNVPKETISVTCFKGDTNAPKDKESHTIWKHLGIQKITFLGKKDNWWGPAGATGPCGPDTEMFVNGVEIWNDVFMEYVKDKKGTYLPATQKNIDTGMGVERTLAILNNLNDNYLTEVWKPIINTIEKISQKKYTSHKKVMRIIADHLKAAVFILAEDITPSNKEHGYVLRRLVRRAIRHAKTLDMKNFTQTIAQSVFAIYPDYDHLKENKTKIIKELQNEEERFNQTLEKGLKLFEKLTKNKKQLSGKDAFLLYQSYGFPIEMTTELAKEKKIKLSIKDFNKELVQHQERSQTASAKKFTSGLSDHSQKTTRLHTATHLLLAALRKVLNNKTILQKGSNITPERLRFDFSFERKLTLDEIQSVEDLVNKQIKKSIRINREEMKTKDALKSGALGIFGEKYPEVVSVYNIGNFSKEICTGPHANNTSELGHFKIIKEESSSAGVRRIKAVLTEHSSSTK